MLMLTSFFKKLFYKAPVQQHEPSLELIKNINLINRDIFFKARYPAYNYIRISTKIGNLTSYNKKLKYCLDMFDSEEKIFEVNQFFVEEQTFYLWEFVADSFYNGTTAEQVNLFLNLSVEFVNRYKAFIFKQEIDFKTQKKGKIYHLVFKDLQSIVRDLNRID
jgi:hypothetical protein